MPHQFTLKGLLILTLNEISLLTNELEPDRPQSDQFAKNPPTSQNYDFTTKSVLMNHLPTCQSSTQIKACTKLS